MDDASCFPTEGQADNNQPPLEQGLRSVGKVAGVVEGRKKRGRGQSLIDLILPDFSCLGPGGQPRAGASFTDDFLWGERVVC